MRVYLAEPIRGCLDEECKGWRARRYGAREEAEVVRA